MQKIGFYIFTKTVGLYINLLSFIYPDKAISIAYQFFSEPREGKLKREKLPKSLKNAELETIQHNSHIFQTYIWKGGEKNNILLVHGWESNASRWKNFLPHLKKTGSTIIAIDAPAHGLSSGKEFNVPTYAEFIDISVQKYNPKIIIGHSLGGAASVFYMHKYQNKNIEKMVILGAPSDLKIIINNYIQMLSLNARVTSLLEKHFIDKFKFRIEEFTGHHFVQNFDIKGFIAHDINDNIVLVHEGKKFAQHWKNATYIETQGLGHSMHDDNLYQKITHFLREN